MIPLTKIMDGKQDFPLLTRELLKVDDFEIVSPGRRWEYAMALRAVNLWKSLQPTSGDYLIGEMAARLDIDPVMLLPSGLDVGGAGSPLVSMLRGSQLRASVLDPHTNCDLHTFLALAPRIAANPTLPPEDRVADVVTCVSVIEHVKEEQQFVADLRRVVAPGGLLFLTTDIKDEEEDPEDNRHFHWMRERIYMLSSWMKLASVFIFNGFEFLGDAVDWSYHEDQVYGSAHASTGYSFASLALVRTRKRGKR